MMVFVKVIEWEIWGAISGFRFGLESGLGLGLELREALREEVEFRAE